ncbi:MAG: hypothetical protein GY847_38640 [Proteobacteria bacterium]|nr:hypothetical protein [Pseudomonadota bacterium]
MDSCIRTICVYMKANLFQQVNFYILLALAMGALGVGCLEVPILPAQMSVAKFVRQSNSVPPASKDKPSDPQPASEDETSDATPVSEAESSAAPPAPEDKTNATDTLVEKTDEAGSSGKVTGSTGLFFNVSSDFDTLLILFPIEAAWTGWLSERYDLSISGNNSGLLGLEGNGTFVSNNDVRHYSEITWRSSVVPESSSTLVKCRMG